jgi:diaminobutyrate-2-oxoglutarate transaminase
MTVRMTPNMRDHCHLSSTRLSKIVQETRSRSIDPREGCVPPGGAECGLHFFVNADMSLERYESVAQSRVLRVPVVFDRAGTFELFDETGNPYFDFCSGGYGHNDFDVHAALTSYLSSGRIIGSSDRECMVKRRFVDEFTSRILEPRNMHYRIVFTNPASGTAAEAAIKLARRSKKRKRIVAFTHSCHGWTGASLAVTSRSEMRRFDILLASNTTFMPFCGFFGSDLDTIRCFRRFLEDPASGLDRPAAVIVETIQVHGGVRIASPAWLKAMADLCLEFGMLLIVDESLTGCGATGPYFSFEDINLIPDMVIAPNAIAGGLAMSMVLVRPDIDGVALLRARGRCAARSS